MATRVDPRQQLMAIVAKVRGWAKQLRTGAESGYSVIAEREKMSVARVSQLMVLNHLTPDEVEACLSRPIRQRVRGLIQYARSRRSGD